MPTARLRGVLEGQMPFVEEGPNCGNGIWQSAIYENGVKIIEMRKQLRGLIKEGRSSRRVARWDRRNEKMAAAKAGPNVRLEETMQFLEDSSRIMRPCTLQKIVGKYGVDRDRGRHLEGLLAPPFIFGAY